MKKQPFSTLLASAAILGSSMVGCSGASVEHRPALTAEHAPDLAPRVEKALASKDYARALMQAEELVAAAPADATYRVLLGRAYLANGRYESARTALTDAMTLGDRGTRTIVSLALAETALGNGDGARAMLVAHIADLPAGDYGLAMAMSGDPREGVRALLEATKQPEATAQTRQNLAYALALAGAWGQARLIAGQDMSAKEAEARIGQWSQAVMRGDARSRVVAMIGVAPRDDDTGLPTRLALNNAAAPVEMAAAGDLTAQAVQDVAAAAVVDAPVVAHEPVPPSVAFVDAAPVVEAPVIRAPADPMREAVRAAFDRTPGPVAPVARTASAAGPIGDAHASDWVVQLGAFNSAAIAKSGWQMLSRKAPAIAGYPQIQSQVALGGRAFHRVAIRGFGDRKAADSFCQSLRASAQSCFVRLDDTGTTRTARAKAKAGTDVAVRKAAGSARIAAR